jgi:hypothetical protein
MRGCFFSVALSGEISYLDANDASRPVRKITGHNKSITSCAITHDKRTLFTGDAEGQIGERACACICALFHAVRWDLASSTCIRVAPKIHTANVTALFVHGDASALTSTAWDDTVAVNHTVMKQGIGECLHRATRTQTYVTCDMCRPRTHREHETGESATRRGRQLRRHGDGCGVSERSMRVAFWRSGACTSNGRRVHVY